MKIVKLTGQIELLSGLHIGCGDDTMKIGGIDNGVIKDVNTDKPYIPGSSLKGKMRSLLEWNYGLVGFSDGSPFSAKFIKGTFPDEKIEIATKLMKLFGASITKKDEEVLEDKKIELGITRINVGDCHISQVSMKMKHLEAKMENVIDRHTGSAKHGVGARQTERVPAGVKFDYDIRVKIFDGDDEKAMKKMIKRGLELIENDYLGGSGSRGYGRVEFSNKENWTE